MTEEESCETFNIYVENYRHLDFNIILPNVINWNTRIDIVGLYLRK